MSASPVARLFIAALSFGGGVAAGLLAASLARRETRQRREGGVPERSWRVGAHAYADSIPDAEPPVAQELDLSGATETDYSHASASRRP